MGDCFRGRFLISANLSDLFTREAEGPVRGKARSGKCTAYQRPHQILSRAGIGGEGNT